MNQQTASSKVLRTRRVGHLRGAALSLALLLALTVLGAAHYYLARRLFLDPSWPEWIAVTGTSAVFLLGGSIVLAPIAERTLAPRVARYVAWPAFVWLGACFYLLLGLWASDAVLGLLGRSDLAVWRMRALGVGVGALALVLLGMRTVARGPALREVQLRLSRWPRALDGYRIVQISDVHIGPMLHAAFARRVVALTRAGAPDLIALTGDLVDGSVRQLAAEVLPFAELRAPDGVFFVAGNHDFYSGAGRWSKKVEELGMRALRNVHVTVTRADARFVLAGVDDPTGRRMGGAGDDVQSAVRGAPAGLPVVLLAHDPRTFRSAAEHGVDLQISGHTHGGQMWPFSWLVRLQTRFVAGLYRLGGSQLYVSRGTGFWGPPMRVLAPAEVTVLVLRSAA